MINYSEFLDNFQRGAKKTRWFVVPCGAYIIATVVFILVAK